MGKRAARIYCAGPLFNDKEREEMAQVARALEDAGFRTFLPQRDGLELTRCLDALTEKGFEKEQAADMLCEAIFALDVYQLLEGCHGIVVNLNGRVPDEGAVSEAAMAWTEGKAIVGYKADGRSAFVGRDNPLVAGLFDFKMCHSVRELVPAMRIALSAAKSQEERKSRRRRQIECYLTLGERLSAALQNKDKADSVARILFEDARCKKMHQVEWHLPTAK